MKKRVIKYRIWDNGDKRFLIYKLRRTCGGSFKGNWETKVSKVKVSSKKPVLQQYLGINDSRGIEICEGDLIQANVYGCKGIFEIYYSVEDAAWWIKGKSGIGALGEAIHCGKFKVVGNIFENKDLLNT